MARYALRNPWWTLSNFDATRKATALQGDAKSVHWQLSEAATAASTASVTGFNYKEPKTEQEVGGLDMASPLGFPILFISFPFYLFFIIFLILLLYLFDFHQYIAAGGFHGCCRGGAVNIITTIWICCECV